MLFWCGSGSISAESGKSQRKSPLRALEFIICAHRLAEDNVNQYSWYFMFKGSASTSLFQNQTALNPSGSFTLDCPALQLSLFILHSVSSYCNMFYCDYSGRLGSSVSNRLAAVIWYLGAYKYWMSPFVLISLVISFSTFVLDPSTLVLNTVVKLHWTLTS